MTENQFTHSLSVGVSFSLGCRINNEHHNNNRNKSDSLIKMSLANNIFHPPFWRKHKQANFKNSKICKCVSRARFLWLKVIRVRYFEILTVLTGACHFGQLSQYNDRQNVDCFFLSSVVLSVFWISKRQTKHAQFHMVYDSSTQN